MKKALMVINDKLISDISEMDDKSLRQRGVQLDLEMLK